MRSSFENLLQNPRERERAKIFDLTNNFSFFFFFFAVESVNWLKGPKRSPSDVECWSIDVGTTIKEIHSSRFCPATLISQLNEARKNASVLHTPEGKELMKTLEDQQSSRPSNITAVLQQCGLLSTECREGFIQDISGNARFVSEMVERGVCSPEQCLVGRSFPTVPVDNCSTHTSSESEKIGRSVREAFDEERAASNATLGMRSQHKARIILGSSLKHCPELFSCDELSTKSSLLQQCVTALHLLEKGDCLVLEISDTLTQFTVAIIYILHLLFQEISLTTPSFSATSTQFMVSRHFLNSPQSLTLRVHLEKVLETLTTKSAGKDVIGFLPIQELFSEKFYKYMRRQTTRHISAQLHCIVQCERLLFSKHAS